MTDQVTDAATPDVPPDAPLCSLPLDWPTVYLDELAAAIHFRTTIHDANVSIAKQEEPDPIGFRPPDTDVLLYRLYALLAVTTGTGTTLEHVHDAWAVWTLGSRPEHRSLIPFEDLSDRVQALDKPYRDAIVDVARGFSAAKRPKVSRQAGSDPRSPHVLLEDMVRRFAASRQINPNAMTLADRFADELIENVYTPNDLRALVQQAQRDRVTVEFDYKSGPVAITVNERIAAWVTLGFSFATERWQWDARCREVTPLPRASSV